jgi:hypothetical protein
LNALARLSGISQKQEVKMKKMNLVISAALLVAGFAACQGPASQAKQDAESLNNYVDSVDKLTPVYTAVYWSELENGYQLRVANMDNTMATLEAAEKAKLEESKAKYAALKATYESRIKEAEANAATSALDYRQVLRNKLFGEGVVGSDMGFGFANAANLLSIYRNFVNTVDANKNIYSREDWDEVKVLYEALDTRKNTVEKDLPKGDNNKIAGLKIKFAAIKATHRGGTKGAENQEAKDKS